MALSMDEQRMLAEIERRLAAEDPGLATRLTAFRRPRPASGLRTTQGKVIGAICTVVLLAVIAVTVFAMIAVRAHTQRTPTATRSASSQSAGASTPAAPTRIAGIDGTVSHNG